mgnify:CR=1 FL=1
MFPNTFITIQLWIEDTPSSLLVWCSGVKNNIDVFDLETNQAQFTFEGAQLKYKDRIWLF